MSERYQAIHWNQHKRVFDLLVLGAIAAYPILFVGVVVGTTSATEMPDDAVLASRATGTLAVLMLHVVLMIGPLARLSSLFNVLLYNRRHLGVLTFAVATAHGAINLVWYFSDGVFANPLTAAAATAVGPLTPAGLPFHLLGVGAWLILLVMASTSHDFWVAKLGPAVWKWLHMGVYVAYALVLGHVLLGAVQTGRGGGYGAMLGVGFALVAGLHLAAGVRENNRDEVAADEAWVDVGAVSELSDGCGRTVRLRDGRAVALFRDGERVWALSNVCPHQQGPLGEGRIVDGCVTCPWHGHQYRPEDGRAPEPYDQRVPTYRVEVRGDRVMLDPEPLPPGSAREPGVVGGRASTAPRGAPAAARSGQRSPSPPTAPGADA